MATKKKIKIEPNSAKVKTARKLHAKISRQWAVEVAKKESGIECRRQHEMSYSRRSTVTYNNYNY